MMATRFILLVMIGAFACQVQTQTLWGFKINEETNRIYFAETIVEPDVGKDLLYSRAKEWIILKGFDQPVLIDKKFNHYFFDDPWKFDDPNNGTMITDGYFKIHYRSPETDRFYVTFQLRMKTAPGKYRYEFTNFYVNEFISGKPKPPSERDPGNKNSDNIVFETFTFEEFFESGTRRKDDNLAFPEFRDKMRNMIAELQRFMAGDEGW